ncbi:hypothetical protein N4G70_12425 [Streptomyces sp. ASQP_92]|nr:hypothetical protein [Streptomyces sp. ASQP_92]
MPGTGGCKNTTPTSGAPAGRTTVGGPAAYWTSYAYDRTGNRTGLTQHDITGDTGKDITTTQIFAPAGQDNQPTTAPNTGGGTGGAHALLSTSASGPGNPGASSYQYDATGNTTAITTSAGTTSLTWDAQSELTSLTPNGGSAGTSYVYDADGNQLIRHDPGKSTLHLGPDDLTLDTATGALTAARTYALPNGLTAVRQGSGLTWQTTDHHGTAVLALDSTSLGETRRPVDPFGAARGTQPSHWAGEHGFVGGTQDPATGLTNLGAREYQPASGRFINPDPVLDENQPQQWNGYSYSNDNPVNQSDPAGTDPPGTQNSCSYDLRNCTKEECAGVQGVPCGPQGKSHTGTMDNGKSDDGRPTLDGVRVPTYRELLSRNPGGGKKLPTYKRLIADWIRQECSMSAASDKMAHFCSDAGDSGLLGSPKKGSKADQTLDMIAVMSTGKGTESTDDPYVKSGTTLQQQLWEHVYVSGSFCLMLCASVGFQNGNLSATVSGGMTFDTIKGAKQLFSGKAGAYMGVSVGWNTAKPSDQKIQLGGVTVADGPWGASGGVGQRSSGGYYYFGGWAGGAGWAPQGPTTFGGQCSFQAGCSWAGPK